MSSPFAHSDLSPSSQRSTPSRSLPKSSRRNGYHRNLRDSTNNSPSRQLIDDYSRMLINDERNLRSSLDEQSAAQHKLHVEALDRALAKHEQVRESAERLRVRLELEAEKERRRQEEEEKRAVEKARRELEEQKLAAERRRLEEETARVEERRKQEELKREQEEAKQRAEKERKQREEDEQARKAKAEKDEADRKQKEEAEANQRAQQAEAEKQKVAQQATAVAAASAPQTNGISGARPTVQPAGASTHTGPDLPAGLVSTANEREVVHRKYLDLHQRLKSMRTQVLDEAKRTGVKNQLSESRRTIQKCCGQLSKLATPEAKETNRRATLEIVKQLDTAAQMSQPSIDITNYLVQNFQPPDANTHGPAALLYLLNHFAKSIVRQLISESAVDAKSADSLGVLAVTIFARPQYLFNGQSLIDLLWAKYHKHAPMLFGISASERSKEGRARVGWAVNRDAGTFVSEQEHYDRLSGLASGFAAITLRDFSKSKNSNPAPNRIFWEAMARIMNTSPQDLQPSHFVLLKAMVANSVPRIITTFGDLGIVALRQALIYFPEEKGLVDEKGRKISSVAALQALPAVLQREQDLTL